MKNKSLFASRLLVTIIIAGLASSAIGFILVFIFGNLGLHEEAFESINAAIGVLFGVMCGYRLNDLIREFKK